MTLKLLTRLHFGIQRDLLPALEEVTGPLGDKDKSFVKVCELLSLEKQVEACGWKGNGRPPKSHLKMAHAFALFADIGLGERTHQTLIATHLGQEIIWHAATDSTAIEAREKAFKEPPAKPATEEPKRGRPRKGEEPPSPEPTRLERHLEGTHLANLQDMPPVCCNHGCKKNSQGNTDYWRGYKLHLITGNGDIPLCAYLSSASLHDSQAAILLEQHLAQRTGAVLYQLKDSAYDAQAIRAHSVKMGSIPIIQKRDYRAPESIPMEPDRTRHYNARSSVERSNSDLKDNHGGRTLRVRGAAKVMTHLMFGTYDRRLHKCMAHVLRAWVIEDGISAWHIMCDDKSNELSALPQLIEALDLTGATVTIDAMAGHPHIIEQIHAGGAHYVQALKANEKEAYETVKANFEALNASLQPTGIPGAPARHHAPMLPTEEQQQALGVQMAETIEHSHGRYEHRRVSVIQGLHWYAKSWKWAGLQSIVRVERWTQRGEKSGELAYEAHYYLSDLSAEAHEFGRIIRAHWQVENKCHYVLDVTFNEDHCQVRDVQAAHNLCIMREMVIKVLKSNKAKGSLRSKCKRAAHDVEFRTAMLTQIP